MTDFSSLTQKDAARAVGRSTRTVQSWSDQGCPRNPDGSYPLPDLVAWLVARAAGVGGGDRLDAEQARARKDTALAERTEMQNALSRGELLRAEDAQRVWVDHIASARSKLLQLPSRLGPVLVGKSPEVIAATIRAQVYDALRALASSMDDDE